MMKKVSKIVLIAAGGIFVLGLILHLVGTSMGGRSQAWERIPAWTWDWEDDWDEGWHGHWSEFGGRLGDRIEAVVEGVVDGIPGGATRKSGSSQDAFTELDVSIDYGDIKLVEGTGYSVFLDWNVDYYDMYYENKNGTLTVWSAAHGHRSNTLGKAAVTITVPAGTALGEVELETSMGDVSVDLSATARKAELVTDMGDVTCARLTATELDADTSMGDVTIAFPERDGVSYELYTSLGEVWLNGEKQRHTVSGGHGSLYDIEAGTDMGNVTLDLG